MDKTADHAEAAAKAVQSAADALVEIEARASILAAALADLKACAAAGYDLGDAQTSVLIDGLIAGLGEIEGAADGAWMELRGQANVRPYGSAARA